MSAKPPPLPPRGNRPLPPPRKPSPSVDAIPNHEAGHFADTESPTAKRTIHTELALFAGYYKRMHPKNRERILKAAEFYANLEPPEALMKPK